MLWGAFSAASPDCDSFFTTKTTPTRAGRRERKKIRRTSVSKRNSRALVIASKSSFSSRFRFYAREVVVVVVLRCCTRGCFSPKNDGENVALFVLKRASTMPRSAAGKAKRRRKRDFDDDTTEEEEESESKKKRKRRKRGSKISSETKFEGDAHRALFHVIGKKRNFCHDDDDDEEEREESRFGRRIRRRRRRRTKIRTKKRKQHQKHQKSEIRRRGRRYRRREQSARVGTDPGREAKTVRPDGTAGRRLGRIVERCRVRRRRQKKKRKKQL